MTNNKNNSFTIICDTREKTPWQFKNYPMFMDKVDYGDYTIEGMEKYFSIERKASTGEFAGNMVEKRFPKLLRKLSLIPHKYIICEFSFENVVNYPVGSGIPRNKQKRIRISGNWMAKYFAEILVMYQIPVIFAGNATNAEHIAYNIMKETVLKYRTSEAKTEKSKK